ncbi:DUF4235 domain-containing protein [Pseudonocardia sp. DLS-67]
MFGTRVIGYPAVMKRGDGNELTGLEKLAYKPIGLIFGLIGGLLAGKVFGMVWKRISDEDETPQPLSDAYSTREVLLAATLQGAIFGLIKTAVDRYGMKGVRRFLDTPRPPARRPVEVSTDAGQGRAYVGS